MVTAALEEGWNRGNHPSKAHKAMPDRYCRDCGRSWNINGKDRQCRVYAMVSVNLLHISEPGFRPAFRA